jgi:hypothetical protein
MQRLEASLREVDPADYLGRDADLRDVSTVIDQDTLVTRNGKVVLGYLSNIGGDIDGLRNAFDESSSSFITGFRATKSKAMRPTAVTFGYMPRLEIRVATKACRIASLYAKNKSLHDLLIAWTQSVTKFYSELAPEASSAHLNETVERVREEYRIPKSMFTSGIVNKSSQLPYHFDSGNFKGAWSAMLGLSKGIHGGHLVIPEYDMALAISDGSLSFFDGQSKLHGVSPFRRKWEGAERYTVVWYSLEKLWQCLSNREEIANANRSVTEINRKRAGRADD